ncbi:MAG: zinc metallopeptidase [Firmicutes bacterium]|nr:zinc metallopeptidase [Bacillota bacterium]
MPFFGWYWDPTYIIVLPALLLVMWAQWRVQATFQEWSRRWSSRGLTGAQVARAILDRAGLHDVDVEPIPGHLTDHYDPRARVLRLSQSVYNSSSVAAIGVAAHEAGHAIQHDVGYVPLMMRSAFVPLANLGSTGGPLLFFLGLLFPRGIGDWMMQTGILLFGLAVLFYVITLPVEFNASSRALAILEGQGYLVGEELRGARAVLWAAAMTYVASAAMAISQLLRLLAIRGLYRDEE